MIRSWVEDCGDMVMMMMTEWSLDLTNLYITLSVICQTIFFAPAKVTCVEKNIDTSKLCCSEHIL